MENDTERLKNPKAAGRSAVSCRGFLPGTLLAVDSPWGERVAGRRPCDLCARKTNCPTASLPISSPPAVDAISPRGIWFLALIATVDSVAAPRGVRHAQEHCLGSNRNPVRDAAGTPFGITGIRRAEAQRIIGAAGAQHHQSSVVNLLWSRVECLFARVGYAQARVRDRQPAAYAAGGREESRSTLRPHRRIRADCPQCTAGKISSTIKTGAA